MKLNFTSKEITQILNISASNIERHYTSISIDSRKVYLPESTLFIAISGINNDGHDFIEQLYKNGVRGFIISKNIDLNKYPEAEFFRVDNTINALQLLAGSHREKMSIKILSITGSNGKTIVKEALYNLLKDEILIVKSPKSYNSQIGVALSLLEIEPHHQLGIFEAGISHPGEMESLRKMLQPDYGVLVSLGTAHLKNFDSQEQLKREKLSLFQNCNTIVLPNDIDSTYKNTITFGLTSADIIINKENREKFIFENNNEKWEVTRKSGVIAENIACCIATIQMLGLLPKDLESKLNALKPLTLRLEIVKGHNGNTIINDAYNNDLIGLEIALDQLHGHENDANILVLSDLEHDSQNINEVYKRAALIINQSKTTNVLGVGKNITLIQQYLNIDFKSFNSIENIDWSSYQNSTIILKGARHYHFEKALLTLEHRSHDAEMAIDLTALQHNITSLKSHLKTTTQLMVMVKAGAYGSGLVEMGSFLERQNVDYLGVAYAQEGESLRIGNIRLPIMVMNASTNHFPTILQYNLEPTIHNLNQLDQFIASCIHHQKINYPIHIKLDTGMHRLGFEEEDLEQLITVLKSQPEVKVASVYSHLVATDDPKHRDYTLSQIDKYKSYRRILSEGISYHFISHILNSSGIVNFSEAQFDLVRTGIGIFGLNAFEGQDTLRLDVSISSIKHIKKGDSVGYGRSYFAEKDIVIATLPIGYADGLSRGLSNGKWHFKSEEKHFPIIGNICMDMCMVDISSYPQLTIGDTLTLFDSNEEIKKMASILDTIPYEILTGFSDRIRRIFIG